MTFEKTMVFLRILFFATFIFFFLLITIPFRNQVTLTIDLTENINDELVLFTSDSLLFNPGQSLALSASKTNRLVYKLPDKPIYCFRLDIGSKPGVIGFSNMEMKAGLFTRRWEGAEITNVFEPVSHITNVIISNNAVYYYSGSSDPYLISRENTRYIYNGFYYDKTIFLLILPLLVLTIILVKRRLEKQ